MFSKNVLKLLFFSLTPKSYYSFDMGSDKFKRSSKGIQHRTKLSYKTYYNVLYGDLLHEVENNVIRIGKNPGEMGSYKMRKIGLTDFHVKNFVKEDRITTIPFSEIK